MSLSSQVLQEHGNRHIQFDILATDTEVQNVFLVSRQHRPISTLSLDELNRGKVPNCDLDQAVLNSCC
jgi:hypothetical protein